LKSYLYAHGGSDNHGCEAIIRTTQELINPLSHSLTLYVYRGFDETQYGIDDLYNDIIPYHDLIKPKTPRYFLNKFLWKVFNYNNYFYRYSDRAILDNIDAQGLYLSVGGDNYCYGHYYKNLGYINKKISKKAMTVLWGVSIEPELLKIPAVVADMNRYRCIVARESITYKALVERGIKSDLHLIPDSAFILKAEETEMSKRLRLDKSTLKVGINLSPLVRKLDADNDMAYKNVQTLMHYLLNSTEAKLILIPHVVQDGNNDYEVLKSLYESFNEDHKQRMYLIADQNCCQLKAVIGGCDLFVGARTHATIAAYSSGIPTLVLGYSVKSKGIAKDLFGTDENYVLSIQELSTEMALTRGFKWLMDHQSDIREILAEKIPEYQTRIRNSTKIISDLVNEPQ